MQPITHAGLVLRSFRSTDAANFARAARESVDTVGRWMSWCNSSFSELDALAWFSQCRSGKRRQTAYEVGIFSASTGELLGGAGLNAIQRHNLLCNLGYWVKQSAQRQGIASHTVQALVPYAFDTLGMQRVEIVVAVGNTPSEAVARKAGAEFEGVARNRIQLHGKAVPASIFSLVP
ncbi:GNAT family N-acetyltransferase [Bordetella genomosp. 1]|uniref:GNAT family N-acetyltransferase n=1 Tax=Bordetella genomosp. 1 TaxID=1395607 RepID=A0ABX4F1N2_9BORD|nr:GNAT family protein [Bordetella genomosp. 1]OZI64259.1 GNAT family N-acetyltransferase [Bordetella genomosp. 1]